MEQFFKTINPFNRQVLEKHRFDSLSEIKEVIERSYQSYQGWNQLSLSERIECLKKFRDSIEENIQMLAVQATKEMGKPISESLSEIKKCLGMMDYYFENAGSFLRPLSISSTFSKSQIHYSSQGIIFGIMPWNFPYWQVLRFSIPTLLVGNTVLVKHAPNVQGCQNLLQKVFLNSCRSSNLNSIFSTVKSHNQDVPDIISHHLIRGVSFTGSESTGRYIGELAGKHLKKVVLELGGSDAYLVLPDADVKFAVEQCFKARFVNSGQSCVAAKRWIVHTSLRNCFLKNLKEIFDRTFNDKYTDGFVDPAQSDCILGPMARLDLKQNLYHQVSSSLKQGAEIFLGHLSDIKNDSCFFAPIVLDKVRPGMTAFDEELFGPVATIIWAENVEEMIDLANQSKFGLGGAIFSSNIELATSIATNRLDTGGVFINQSYQSHAALPFGGVKASGMGRELSHLALYEFANIKTIVI